MRAREFRFISGENDAICRLVDFSLERLFSSALFISRYGFTCIERKTNWYEAYGEELFEILSVLLNKDNEMVFTK